MFQPIARMIGQIEQCVDLRDRHSLACLSHFGDFVAGADLAFPQDAEVEPRASAGCQQRGHARLARPNANAIAGNTRLSDLEQRAADLITVADADIVVWQALYREVLAELPMDEGRVQLFLPVPIRFN